MNLALSKNPNFYNYDINHFILENVQTRGQLYCQGAEVLVYMTNPGSVTEPIQYYLITDSFIDSLLLLANNLIIG